MTACISTTHNCRPVYTLELALSGAAGVAYFDMSAQHVVNEKPESVGWSTYVMHAAHRSICTLVDVHAGAPPFMRAR